MKARKPFIYLAAIAAFLGILGIVMLNQDLSGNVVLKHELTANQIKDVAQHNNFGDCWIIAEDKVYDITFVIASYPEFSYFKTRCGSEASQELDSLSDLDKKIFSKYIIEL